RGIGAAVAKRFAAEGATVILLARTLAALEEIDDEIRSSGGHAVLAPLDLNDQDKIDQMGMGLYQRFGKLDILVGNAGYLGDLTPLSHLEPKIWERVMRVNVTANWRLIRILEPVLKQAEAPRAIFTTSGVTLSVHPYWGAYASSKAALEAMVQTWAGETVKTELRVNLVDPGAVRTRMRALAFPGEDPNTLPTPESITETFVQLAEPACIRHGEVVRAY
ncbi:MAG: SDR family NAD(P)-dependent oxidoreductase, partial [Rhodospirillales bacterium]|nr:SDR family NAD(P)-dependent oxidoreductase [Rhodospirillales bacterium]